MPAWKKGQSGNLNGRPPKGRAIASQIEKALNRLDTGSDGKKHRRVNVLAEIWINALLTGTVTLPNGTTMMLPPREWFELGKFVVSHVDGPAKAQLELSGADGAPMEIGVTLVDYRNGLAAPASGSAGNSDAPSPDQTAGDGEAVG